jgi:hypothetical protein
MGYIDDQIKAARNTLENRKQANDIARIHSDADAAIRKANLNLIGPPKDRYDYDAAYADGNSFEPDDDGGINLPNKYASGLTIAGQDIATLQQTGPYIEDAHGYIQYGREQLANSHYNTAKGHPDRDADGLMNVFRGAAHAGVDPKEVDTSGWPKDMVEQARQGGQLLAAVDKQMRTYRQFGQVNAPASIPQDDWDAVPDTFKVAPMVADGEKVPLEVMKQDPGWLEDARLLHLYDEGEEFEGDDAELADWAVTHMSDSINQLSDILIDIGAISSGMMDDETAAALTRQLQRYEMTEDWHPQIIWETVASMGTDIAMFTGLGSVAKTILHAPTRAALRRLYAKAVSTRFGAAATFAGTSAAGGAGGMAGLETRDQMAAVEGGQQENIDWGQVGTMSAMGGVAGLVLGGGVYGGAKMVKGAAKNWRSVMEPSPMRGSPQAQRGSIGFIKTSSQPGFKTPDAPRYQYGEDVGDRFYSRLEKKVGEIVPKKGIRAAQLVGMLKSDKIRQGEEGFAIEELYDSGLLRMLQEKLDGSKDATVSKAEVESFLKKNRTVISAETVEADNMQFWGQVGARQYVPERMKAVSLERKFGPDNEDFIRRYLEVKDDIDGSEALAAEDPDLFYSIDDAYRGVDEFTEQGRLNDDGVRIRLANTLTERAYDIVPDGNGEYRILTKSGEDAKGKPVFGREQAKFDTLNAMLDFTRGLEIDQMAGLIAQYDRKAITQPPQYRIMLFNNKGVGFDPSAQGYAEMRLFMPVGDNPFREAAHYPMEANRIAHVRMHDVYDQDGGKVLMVDELQSDRATEYMKLRKDMKNRPSKADDPKHQHSWDEIAFRQVLSYAAEKGYTKIAWPRTVAQIASIEGWDADVASKPNKHIMHIYDKRLPAIVKRMKGRYGTSLSKHNVFDAAGQVIDPSRTVGGKMEDVANIHGIDNSSEVFVMTLDPKKARASKAKKMPINGFIALPGGGIGLGELAEEE